MLTATAIITIARSHLGNGAAMDSSARSCIDDAERLLAEGRIDLAKQWALRSLSYSVGLFHPDYARIAAVVPRQSAR